MSERNWDHEEWTRIARAHGVAAANAARRVLKLKRSAALSEVAPGRWSNLTRWLRRRRSVLRGLVSQSGERSVVAPGECFQCRGWGLEDGGLGEGWCPDCGGTGRGGGAAGAPA